MKLELKVWGGTDEVIYFSVERFYLRSFLHESQLHALVSEKGDTLLDIRSLKPSVPFSLFLLVLNDAIKTLRAPLFLKLSLL